MDTDRLNRWLALGANFGVLIGLLLLVAEIRQTNAIAKAEAINEMTRNTYTILQMFRDSRNITALDRVNKVGWDELNHEEQLLLSSVQSMFMSHVQNAYYQHKLGIYNDEQFDAVLWNMEQALKIGWRRTFWDNARNSYTREFRVFVDSRLEEMANYASE